MEMGTLEHARAADENARSIKLQISVGAVSVDRLIRGFVCVLLAGVAALVVWAGTADYTLRVQSTTPTFLALVNELGEHPLTKQSPFLGNPDVETRQATPYMQTLGFVWRFLGGSQAAPVSLARLLTLIGIGVFGLTLTAVFFYARRLAGSRVAWLSLPVLLGLFGPAHVVWASDLTLHGAVYSAFFPSTLAIGLALLALLALEQPAAVWLAVSAFLAATTLLVHPLTGLLLCALATADSCRRAVRGEPSYLRSPIALAGGFALASLWPAYSIDHALAQSGLGGLHLICVCVALPCCFRLGALQNLATSAARGASGLLRRVERPGATLALALLGAAGVVALGVWEWLLIGHGPAGSARAAIYWMDGRWRWPLLFATGTVGLAGLVRLARRGRLVPAAWFGGCFTMGVAGALGAAIPAWPTLLLLCQIPLAIGVAIALVAAGGRLTSSLIASALSFSLAVKVLTLVALPSTFTYLGAPAQQIWSLGKHIPPGPGLIASDPDTSYFLPAVTGHSVLTVRADRTGSAREQILAERGYRLLRRYWSGRSDWWQAAQVMWDRGVRYVVVQKSTLLDPAQLEGFPGHSPRRSAAQLSRRLGNYIYENGRIGKLLYDSPRYAVYRLEYSKLFPTEDD
jgi:hypothetical protein